MKRTVFIALVAAGLGVFAPQAQAQYLRFGGAAMNHELMTAGDMANLSQPQNFGTARSMAMGGAFVSLGADMSSLSLNPAGLGMYRRSEISLTPMVGISRGQNPGTDAWVGNGKSRFALANIGAAINVFESSSSPLASMTIGFGVNRIADFNTRYTYTTDSRYDPASPNRLIPTIAEIFGQQLGQNGVFPERASDGNPNGNLGYNIDPYFWPSIMGYNGYMVSARDIDGGQDWGLDCIGRNASIRRSLDVENAGSINEFGISLGANINNFIYVGATLGIQSVYKKQTTVYQEEYGYFNSNGIALDADGEPLDQQLNYANLWQQSVLSGSGVNFKLGVIVRPVGGLRIGMAFHSPTFYSLDRTYRGNIQSQIINNKTDKTLDVDNGTPTQRDEGSNSWEFVSPTRLMFGASYTFGNFAILSVDYERDWYNGTRVKNTPDGLIYNSDYYKSIPGTATSPIGNYKTEFKTNFCATNALRAGLEIRPLPMLALRVGGGFTTSMLKDESLYDDMPVATDSHYFTAGVGVGLSRNVTLDFAYQNLTQNSTRYQLFYSQQTDGNYKTFSGLYETKLTRHFVSMTLGVRF